MARDSNNKLIHKIKRYVLFCFQKVKYCFIGLSFNEGNLEKKTPTKNNFASLPLFMGVLYMRINL